MKTIVEKRRVVQVKGDYDVVVVGGGIAGVSAAVSAAREGVRTCLVEKECACGGLATVGNVIEYLPLCDGMGNQVIGGLGEELLHIAISDGSGHIPECWRQGAEPDKGRRSEKRFRASFNPVSFLLAIEPFLARNGVSLMYDTRFSSISKRDDLISHIIVEGKEGRFAIGCRAVVDSSGDADVCFQAGEETVSGVVNVSCGWFYYFDGKKVCLNRFSRPYDPKGMKVPDNGDGFSADSSEGVTRQVLSTRGFIREKIEELGRINPGIYPLSVPLMPTFRMSRRLKGSVELREEDSGRIFSDSVGMTGDWRRKGPVYYIPLGSLLARFTKNLITAGRCISSGSAWDITRAIPACAVTGEAAGIVAGLHSILRTPGFGDIDICHVRRSLKKRHIMFDSVMTQE